MCIESCQLLLMALAQERSIKFFVFNDFPFTQTTTKTTPKNTKEGYFVCVCVLKKIPFKRKMKILIRFLCSSFNYTSRSHFLHTPSSSFYIISQKAQLKMMTSILHPHTQTIFYTIHITSVYVFVCG